MCSVGGIYRCSLVDYDFIPLIRELFLQMQTRGEDATGFGYCEKGKIHWFKRPGPAKDFVEVAVNGEYIHPDFEAISMHTRHATRGDPKDNVNNHPFISKEFLFALTHNGVISNEYKGEREVQDVDSDIIRVEIEDRLADGRDLFEAVKDTCENLTGSFTFTVLTNKKQLLIARHTNPLAIMYVPVIDSYVYASTATIVEKAVSEVLGLTKGIFLPGPVVEPRSDTISEFADDEVNLHTFRPKWSGYSLASHDWRSKSWDKRPAGATPIEKVEGGKGKSTTLEEYRARGKKKGRKGGMETTRTTGEDSEVQCSICGAWVPFHTVDRDYICKFCRMAGYTKADIDDFYPEDPFYYREEYYLRNVE